MKRLKQQRSFDFLRVLSTTNSSYYPQQMGVTLPQQMELYTTI